MNRENRKKFLVTGYIAVGMLVLSAIVIAVLALTGVIGGTDKGGSLFGDVQITPEEKYPLFAWQTAATEGGTLAVFETAEGSFTAELSDSAAAQKFIELAENGVFSGKEFSVSAENMFIQSSTGGNSFTLEDEGYGCFYGALGFVLDGDSATDSLFVITAKELSGTSKSYLTANSPDESYTAFYEENGGMPQYEGSVLVFAKITEGFDVIEKIASAETSGYTGGYKMTNPVTIDSVIVNVPGE